MVAEITKEVVFTKEATLNTRTIKEMAVETEVDSVAITRSLIHRMEVIMQLIRITIKVEEEEEVEGTIKISNNNNLSKTLVRPNLINMEHLGNLNKPLALLLVNPTYQTKLSDKLKILEEVGINNSEVAEAMRIVVAEAKTAVDTEAPTVEVMDSEGKIEVASEVETEVAFIKINSNSNKCTARMHLAVASSSELIKIHLT